MEHHRLVLREHLNDQGNLFGGYLLKWIDEFAYITVNIEFPNHQFVTIVMDKVEFKHPIKRRSRCTPSIRHLQRLCRSVLACNGNVLTGTCVFQQPATAIA